MPKLQQLKLEFLDEIETLMQRYYPILIDQAFGDASNVLGVNVAFNIDNPAVQRVLDQLGGNITSIPDTLIDAVQSLVGQQAANGWSLDELAKRLKARGIEHAAVIARTETASAYSKGSILAWQESGVVKEQEWLVADPCPICEPLDGVRVPLGKTFDGGFDHPPAHPNCRCALAPVVG